MLDNLVVVSGRKRNGKDTIADYLVHYYGYTKVSFATVIKQVAMVLFNWTDKVFTEEYKEVVDPKWGLSPRQFLQQFGTDIMRVYFREKFPLFDKVVGQDFWLIRTLDDIVDRRLRKVVIADCRFHNEIEYTKKHYSAKNHLYISVKREIELDANSVHASEVEVDDLYRDWTLKNTGSIKDLYKGIEMLAFCEASKGVIL